MITEESIDRWFERNKAQVWRWFLAALPTNLRRYAMDAAFEEAEHPREENGRFTVSGNSGRTKSKKLFLPKQEYAAVMSAINDAFHAKYRHKTGKTCGLLHGGHFYRFKNNGFNEYTIFSKIPIKGNEDYIAEWEMKND